MGIEPTSEAWEASILPLYDARSVWNQSQDSIVAMGRATIGEGILVSNPRLRFDRTVRHTKIISLTA